MGNYERALGYLEKALALNNHHETTLKLVCEIHKRTGDYKKSWKVKTTKGKGFVSCIIHNATDYQLTHLLEKPHLKRNGGLTTPKVHIAPVEEKSIKQYEQEVINVVENGG